MTAFSFLWINEFLRIENEQIVNSKIQFHKIIIRFDLACTNDVARATTGKMPFRFVPRANMKNAFSQTNFTWHLRQRKIYCTFVAVVQLVCWLLPHPGPLFTLPSVQDVPGNYMHRDYEINSLSHTSIHREPESKAKQWKKGNQMLENECTFHSDNGVT